MQRPPDARAAPMYYAPLQPSPIPPPQEVCEPVPLVPRLIGPYAAMKRKVPPQESQPADKRIRPAVDFDAPDVRDLRLLLDTKAQRIAERCAAEGAPEMLPELHGYPLSRVKEDFKGLTTRELDLTQHGGIRLNEFVSKYAGDIVTIIVTQTMAAMILPCCGKQYGSVVAPAHIAPPKPANPASAMDIKSEPLVQPGLGFAPHTGSKDVASRAVAPQTLSENPAVRLQAAVVKYLQRRILATRFRLNQEAYRSTLAANLRGREPAATGMGIIQALKTAKPPGVPLVKKNLIKEINDAAETLAGGLAWPLQSIIPDIYDLAQELQVDRRLVHALDVRAMLKAVTEDPLQNPFKLARRPAAETSSVPGAAVEDADGSPTLTLPPDLAGTSVVPILGPHRELQILLEVWLCLHSVLPEFSNERNAARLRAQADDSIPKPSSGVFESVSYVMEWLREDYKRQWGKVLSVECLGFQSLEELLQWDLFSHIVRVDTAEVQEDGGASRVLVPLFDVLGDLRSLLEEMMEQALAQAQEAKLQSDALPAAGWTDQEYLLAAPMPSLEELKLTFKTRHLYEPDHFRLGFGSFKGLVDANFDLCSLDYTRDAVLGTLVVPNAFARMRAILKVVLGRDQPQPQPQLPQRLAPLEAAVDAAGGCGVVDGGVSVASLEQLYLAVYGHAFDASIQGYRRTVDALGALCDVCSLEGEVVSAPQPGMDSQMLQKIRIRPPRQSDRYSRMLKSKAHHSSNHDPTWQMPHGMPAASNVMPGSLGPMRRAPGPGMPQGNSWLTSPQPPPPPKRAGSSAAGADGINPEVLALMMSDLAQAAPPPPPVPAAAAPPMSLDQIVAAALALGMQMPGGAAGAGGAGTAAGAGGAMPQAAAGAYPTASNAESMHMPSSSGHLQASAYQQQYNSMASYPSSGAGTGQPSAYPGYPPASMPAGKPTAPPAYSMPAPAAAGAGMNYAAASASASSMGYGYGAAPGLSPYEQAWHNGSIAAQQQQQQQQQQSWSHQPQQKQPSEAAAADLQQRQQPWHSYYAAARHHESTPAEEEAAAAGGNPLGRSASVALPSANSTPAPAAAAATAAPQTLAGQASASALTAAAAAPTSAAAVPLSYSQQQYQHYLAAGMLQNNMGAAALPQASSSGAPYQPAPPPPAPQHSGADGSAGTAATRAMAQYLAYQGQQQQQPGGQKPEDYAHMQEHGAAHAAQYPDHQQYAYSQYPGYGQQVASYPHAYAGAYGGSGYGQQEAGAGGYGQHAYAPAYQHPM